MKWGTPLDCTWIIRAEKGKKIYIQFPEYSLKEPNDCNFNFIQIFDEKTDIEHREKNFCGSVADEYMSETDVLFIRYIIISPLRNRVRQSDLIIAVKKLLTFEGDNMFFIEIC